MIKKKVNGTLMDFANMGGGGSDVTANPTGDATDSLRKVQIGTDIYSITVTADTEQSPATKAHTAGEYLTYNHVTYKVKANISIGDSLVVDTNIEAPNLPDGTLILSDDDEAPALYYNELLGKPSVNGVTLTGNKTASDLSLADAGVIPTMVKNGAHNLCTPVKNATQVGTGVTFTANADGTVTANGTASETNIYFWSIDANFSQGDILSFSVNGSEQTYYGQVYQDNPSDAVDTCTSGDKIITHTYENPVCRIVVMAGQTVNNVIFKPMIRLASDPSSEYTPYAMTNRELTENLKDSGWITLNDTYKVYYRKIGKIASIRIFDNNNAQITSTPVAVGTLPEEYRPITNFDYSLVNVAGVVKVIGLLSTGEVTLAASQTTPYFYGQVTYMTN